MYGLKRLDQTVQPDHRVDWWKYPWDFARDVNSGFAVMPTVSLLENIGFAGRAANTTNAYNPSSRLWAGEKELPLRHPAFMQLDLESERKYFNNFFRDVVLSNSRKLSSRGDPKS